MKSVSRIVVDADPEIKRMVEELKEKKGQSIKMIIESLIQEEYERFTKVFSL